MPMIKVGEYEYDKDEDLIDRGSFADVYRGSHIKDKSQTVAIKRINLKKVANKQCPLEIQEREAKILKDLSIKPHCNLITMMFHEKTDNSIFLVMEYCNGGTLREYIREKGTLSETVIRIFFRQIGSGLKFLHDMKIVHRDLKPENILLHFKEDDLQTQGSAVLKIADFGLGRYLLGDESNPTVCGTTNYWAPEIRSRNYDLKVDLWSIGVMIYECLVGASKVHKFIDECIYGTLKTRELLALELSESASQEIQDLITRLLIKDPKNRINSDQLMNHSFISETDRTPRNQVKTKEASHLNEVLRPRGLINLGNACFFNSILQTLTQTHALFKELWEEFCDEKVFISSFLATCKELMITEAAPLNPFELQRELFNRVPRFNNHSPHDSHDCLRHLLNEIRKEEKSSRLKIDGSSSDLNSLTSVDKIFGGHLITVFICRNCGTNYHLFEPCLDMPLPVFLDTKVENPANETINSDVEENRCEGHSVADDQRSITTEEEVMKESDYKQAIKKLMTRLSTPPTDQSSYFSRLHISGYRMSTFSRIFSTPSTRMITLHNCLDQFSREENIHKEYLCINCLNEAIKKGEASEENLKLTSATKQTLIFNPPAVLTIHFKRFELLQGRTKRRKDMVRYPTFLDIAPYCSAECLRNDPPSNNIWYSLYAVVVQYGAIDFGHYKAYVKVREKYKNLERMKTVIQEKYFGHNVTIVELIEMINKNDRQKRTTVEHPKKDKSKWYLVDDGTVRQVKTGEVLEQEAHLLFYERVSENSIIHATEDDVNLSK